VVVGGEHEPVLRHVVGPLFDRDVDHIFEMVAQQVGVTDDELLFGLMEVERSGLVGGKDRLPVVPPATSSILTDVFLPSVS